MVGKRRDWSGTGTEGPPERHRASSFEELLTCPNACQYRLEGLGDGLPKASPLGTRSLMGLEMIQHFCQRVVKPGAKLGDSVAPLSVKPLLDFFGDLPGDQKHDQRS